MFDGRYTVAVDKDVGFALPEDWRPFIGEGRVVYLEMDEEHTCLKLIPESEIDKRPPDKERFEIHIGDDWKIKVPEELRDQAVLEDEVVLIGRCRFARVGDPIFLDGEFDDDEYSPDLWMERMEEGRFEADYQKVVAWSRGQEKISVAAILREFGILPFEGEPILERMKRDGLLEPGITKKTWIVKKQGRLQGVDSRRLPSM